VLSFFFSHCFSQRTSPLLQKRSISKSTAGQLANAEYPVILPKARAGGKKAVASKYNF
jgi:hypothetical protein